MKYFVVCMDSYRVRDAQMFDTTGFTDEEFEEREPHSEDCEEYWHDMEPNPFIAVVAEESAENACEKAGKENRYDPRVLYAIEIGGVSCDGKPE